MIFDKWGTLSPNKTGGEYTKSGFVHSLVPFQ